MRARLYALELATSVRVRPRGRIFHSDDERAEDDPLLVHRFHNLSRKLPELDDLIRRARAMKRLLEAGLACECRRIEDCFLDDCSAGTSEA